MVTTRSQAKSKRVAASVTSPVKEQKKAKIIILDTPTYSYKVGATNVKVYTCAADIIDAYDAYHNHKKTHVVAEKQKQEQFVRSPIVTRSKAKKVEEEKKVASWKNVADTTIEKLKQASTCDERRSFWARTITSLLREIENQSGVENKTLIATEIYKILGYMFNRHFMDFKRYEKFWRVVEDKVKELLIDLERHKQNRKIKDETYSVAKNAFQLVQTFQIMYDSLVFPK